MADTTDKFLIKILSGNHVGAEIQLFDDETVIGSSESADIILTDTLIAPTHLRIVLDTNNIYAIPIAQPTRLSGEEIIEKTVIPNFSIITIGTTHLAIGKGNTQWPDLKLPKVGFIASGKTLEIPTTEETSETDIDKQTNTEESTPETPPKKSQKKAPWKTLAKILGIITILSMVTIGIWSLINNPKPKTSKNPKVEHHEQIEAILKKDEFQKLIINQHMGVSQLTGLVKNNEELSTLTQQINALDFQIILNVITPQILIEHCEYLANSLGVFIRTETNKNNDILIHGFASSSNKLNALRANIKSMIPQSKQISLELIDAEQVIQVINNILKKDKLDEFLSVINLAESSQVEVGGFVLIDKWEDWVHAKKEIEHLFAEFPIIFTDIQKSSEIALEKFLFGSSIAATQGGKIPWLETINGQIFFQGATLKGGWTLKSISQEKIILINNGKHITLNPNE